MPGVTPTKSGHNARRRRLVLVHHNLFVALVHERTLIHDECHARRVGVFVLQPGARQSAHIPRWELTRCRQQHNSHGAIRCGPLCARGVKLRRLYMYPATTLSHFYNHILTTLCNFGNIDPHSCCFGVGLCMPGVKLRCHRPVQTDRLKFDK
eukprot:COSAG02_NODE_4465_length_5334_cov_5.927412_2_plen_152_part_00